MRRLLPALLAAFAVVSSGPAPSAFGQTDAPPAVDPQTVVGPPQGAPLAGDALEERTRHVASLLRCPVCQGLSVGDSPSSMALNMKAQVKELLAAGYTQDQVLAYFEGSYGEFVRLEPPLRGVNWLVWLAPLAGLVAGGVFVAAALRRRAGASASESAPAVPDRDALPDDPDLARYVRRVRELAYGWPDGVPPREEG